MNFCVRHLGLGDERVRAELRRYYRVPHVRGVVRARMMCQAGRCVAVEATAGCVEAWLCVRAPLWVVVRVCQLLR